MDNSMKEEKLLITEAKLINAMILEGLDCLRESSFTNQGLYYQAFYSISCGIERILKLIIIEDYRSKNNNKLPNNGYLKKFSHNIYQMIETYTPKLLEDEVNKNVLTFFSNFAKKSRYYNLDILTGGYNEFLNPLEEWREVENLILEKYNKRKPHLKQKENLEDILNETAFIYLSGMNEKRITTPQELIQEYETLTIRQEYSVLVCFKIIQNLINELSEIEFNNNLYPYLWEVFRNIRGNYTNTEIKKKKKWKNLIV